MTEVRAATAADATHLADIFVAAWRHGYRGVVPDDVIDALDPDEYAAAFAERIARPEPHTAVALDPAGQPIGFAAYESDAEHPGDGYLASLYVHPVAQRAGVARRLLRHVIDAMPGADIRLWVFEPNAPARRLYEAAGFRADGARLTDPRWRTPQIRYLRPADSGRPADPSISSR